MTIPNAFREILEKNQHISGIVNYTVSQYADILKENKLYFFEEYTDHGLSHIESVLNSSERIIRTETWRTVLDNKSSSIGIYILSVILHDIGMHLTPEGFSTLISGKNDHFRIIALDDKTWKELWEDFLDEARRYGDKEKINIIGNVNWNFQIPNLENKDKLNGEDKKLIGEFIRKHHPRIAHEIALNGFPTRNKNISFASDLDFDLRNICGLLARSHGVEIRSLFVYLESNFQDTWVRPYNIELLFLMVVLRIADYFQIDSSRTPDIIVKLKTFNSPISEYEHYKHLDVKYVQPFSKDPETIIFQCEPRNSLVFVKLKELFGDIQKELDKSWAILGEIYGKESKENQPSICYRRVKSNIDNIADYSKTINYVPEKISFNVSNELPKLLIGPLYGNDPTFGVRELLQNAVDSCREREFLEGSAFFGEVFISFYENKGTYFFKIEDNGIGMSLNVIKHYFLEVGSSLRRSSFWKKEFSDVDGNSMIQRSGKFGIGVLAAFLIGNEIILETKNSASQFGFSFQTNLNSDQIEILKISKEKVGTSITIPIDKKIFQALADSEYLFDKWYTHSSPKVNYIDHTDTFASLEFSGLGYEKYAPGYNDCLPNAWQALNSNLFNKIIWTYDPNFYISENDGPLTCNGILIPEALRDYQYENSNGHYSRQYPELILPYISVFDFNGKLPLNLSRNNIDGNLPFEKELLVDIYKDVISKLLLFEFESPGLNNKILIEEKNKFYHPALGELDILYSKAGFILKCNYFQDKNKSKTLLRFSHIKDDDESYFELDQNLIQIIVEEELAMTNFLYRMNLNEIRSGGKLFLDIDMYRRLFDNDYNRYPIGVRRNHKLIDENDVSVEISYNYPDGIYKLTDLQQNVKSCNFILETKMEELSRSELATTENIFTELLDHFLDGESLIPYDINERKLKFTKAFQELKAYFKKYLV